MTVKELKKELDKFDDDLIVVAGTPHWECCLMANFKLKVYTKDDMEEYDDWLYPTTSKFGIGGISGLPEGTERVLLIDK